MAADPRGVPQVNVLVGLLTSERTLRYVPSHPTQRVMTNECLANRLGYSGGAVPESHRSSLFVGSDSNPKKGGKSSQPPTHDQMCGLNVLCRYPPVKTLFGKDEDFSWESGGNCLPQTTKKTPERKFVPGQECPIVVFHLV